MSTDELNSANEGQSRLTDGLGAIKENIMNDFIEILRIADTLTNKADADFLRSIAIKVLPPPLPIWERSEKIPGFGYLTSRVF